MSALRIGVYGIGALGYHHARLSAALPGFELVGVHDVDREAARRAANDHGAEIFNDPEELGRQLEAAVVAVPTVAHAEIAVPLLRRGVHCLVEKPVAPDLATADRMIVAAEEGGAVLGVGHVEFYNPAVQVLLASELAADRKADRVGARFVEVQRLGVFSPRSLDVDVVLDLMIHDLQILHALDASPVREVRATGISVLSERVDIANVRVELESGCVANLTASRVSSDKVRKLRVFSPRRYLSLDYGQQEIKGYRLAEGVEGVGEARDVTAWAERAIVPDDLPVASQEPLKGELEAFLARCRGEEVSFVDGREGRRALETALRVLGSLH